MQRIFNYCSCNCCIDKSTQNIESFAYSARILSGFCRCRHRISSICNSTTRIFVVLSRKFDSSPLEKRVVWALFNVRRRAMIILNLLVARHTSEWNYAKQPILRGKTSRRFFFSNFGTFFYLSYNDEKKLSTTVLLRRYGSISNNEFTSMFAPPFDDNG